MLDQLFPGTLLAFTSADETRFMSSYSAVSVGTGWSQIRFLAREKRYFSSPKCPDQLWHPSSQLFSWYWRFVPWR